jgi:hypothetical protein
MLLGGPHNTIKSHLVFTALCFVLFRPIFRFLQSYERALLIRLLHLFCSHNSKLQRNDDQLSNSAASTQTLGENEQWASNVEASLPNTGNLLKLAEAEALIQKLREENSMQKIEVWCFARLSLTQF